MLIRVSAVKFVAVMCQGKCHCDAMYCICFLGISLSRVGPNWVLWYCVPALVSLFLLQDS